MQALIMKCDCLIEIAMAFTEIFFYQTPENKKKKSAKSKYDIFKATIKV